jgi:hypothetical protein
VLFSAGAVVVDVIRDDTGPSATTTDGTTTTQTALETGSSGGDASTRLPDAYVVTRSSQQLIVPPSSRFFEILVLTLLPGRYQVFDKVGLSNRDPQQPFVADCGLVPSTEDGRVRAPGEIGSDAAFLRLGRGGEAGDQGTFDLSVSQVLRKRGAVVLGCTGYGNEHGAFTSYASIRAIEVGSIDENEAPPK